jgi:hypothetical protein
MKMDEETQEWMKLGSHKGGPQKLESAGVRRCACCGQGKCNNNDTSHPSSNEVCEEICKFLVKMRKKYGNG